MTIESLDLDKEKVAQNEAGMMKELDYLNLKALMIETKEFHRMCSELKAYLEDKGEAPQPAAAADQ